MFYRRENIKFIDGIKTKDKGWLKWGGLIGCLIAIINIVFNIISKQSIWNATLSFAFLNAAVVAPLLEEVLFRGFILKTLQKEMPFYMANMITSACFLLMHITRIVFQGSSNYEFV